MIRAVLDTNVLTTAVLTPGRAYDVVRAARDGRFQHVTSAYILDESRRVMTGKLRLNRADVEAILLRLASMSEVHPIFSARRSWCGDSADDAVVETAIMGGADYLVTGDRLLLSAAIDEMRTMTLREFAELLGI